MVQLWIDNRPVEVQAGTTVLAAARRLGIDIPALCHYDGYPPNTSCMCCLTRIQGIGCPAPACATIVEEGMCVESETEEIHQLRRTGLELLLGDHAGDCHAPCENTCPARMDIPDMLRHVVEGDYRSAIATVKSDIALPAILGRVCPEVCENACRRGQHDSPAAICKVKQFVADKDLQSPQPYRPPIAPASGKGVAIVGGGPTGLTAAFHLAQRGHECTIFDRGRELGGRLLTEFSRSVLPHDVLQDEIKSVLALGTTTHTQTELGKEISLDSLSTEFDAVLLATGRSDADWLSAQGFSTTNSGVKMDSHTRMTQRESVFAAGNVVRPYHLVVQSVAEGKHVAECIDCWLRAKTPPNRQQRFESRLAKLSTGELCDFCEGSAITPRVDDKKLAAGLTEDDARHEAERCLNCDCSALDTCLLHHYAKLYDCDARRFRGSGRLYAGRIEGHSVTLEIGKCIGCGICVQVSRAARNAVGLCYVGRSVGIRVEPPPGITLDAALGSAADECARACPTGAIRCLQLSENLAAER